MNINIVNSLVTGLSMVPGGAQLAVDDSDDGGASATGTARFNTKVEFGEREFFVNFALAFETSEGMAVKLGFRSKFATDSVVDDEFKKSGFPYVNAPAIAYPFLRVFVSNLTLNAGYSPVMLPSVNFVTLKEKVMADSAS